MQNMKIFTKVKIEDTALLDLRISDRITVVKRGLDVITIFLDFAAKKLDEGKSKISKIKY